jgi:hypothetical protein
VLAAFGQIPQEVAVQASQTLQRAWSGVVTSLPAWLITVAVAAPAAAQERPETNILLPVEVIEERLRTSEFDVIDLERSRLLEQDRSLRVRLAGRGDEEPLEVHWKPVAPPGYGFNNEPRYILAAYEFQKLFLDETDYVAAPVVLRALSLDEYRRIRAAYAPTITGTNSVLFLLSYWIQDISVDTTDPFSSSLFERDSLYARHFANANLFTHLIDHKDGNHGNVVVSHNFRNRRVFALDNDVAFRSRASDLGARWRRLHVKRLPASSIERLRSITRADLEQALGVVAEFDVVNGLLFAVTPGQNLRADRGVRVQPDRVQFGLTTREIADLEQRIARLLRDVDRGAITTF